MKVFVQKLRIRFNLLLCRWCSKSLWIRFLLQIHQNFQVFGWKWRFDEISNDIFKCIQTSRAFFPSETRILLQKYLGVDIISKWEWELLADMLRKRLCWEKKVNDDTKRSFLGKKCCRIPDLLKKQQGVMVSYIKNPLLGRFFNELWEKHNFGLVDFWCKIMSQQLPFFLPNISLLLFCYPFVASSLQFESYGIYLLPPKKEISIVSPREEKGLFLPFPR